jgi:hypothetical protein
MRDAQQDINGAQDDIATMVRIMTERTALLRQDMMADWCIGMPDVALAINAIPREAFESLRLVEPMRVSQGYDCNGCPTNKVQYVSGMTGARNQLVTLRSEWFVGTVNGCRW